MEKQQVFPKQFIQEFVVVKKSFVLFKCMSYTFFDMTRIGMDDCSQTQEALMNTRACNYMTTRYSTPGVRDLMLSTPGLMLASQHGGDIDASSRLSIGTLQTHPKSRIELFHRPFVTVPYLGRGTVNVDQETEIRLGQHSSQKTALPLSEIRSRKEIVQFPSRPIETLDTGWMYGGIPTRDMSRDVK